ncbi:MAG TPA: hypothetical protein PK595_01825 [Bacteroidota bacterium]|nr:hypothetical protein [Bacteroidota bacterium]
MGKTSAHSAAQNKLVSLESASLKQNFVRTLRSPRFTYHIFLRSVSP